MKPAYSYKQYIIIIIIINAEIKVTLNKEMGHFTKIITTCCQSGKGGLEQSCLQIPAKRLQ